MNTPDNCAVFASQSERFPESHVRFDGFPLMMCLIQGQYHEDIARRIEKACNEHAGLLALVKRYASECGECNGKGWFYVGEGVSGRGPDDVEPERVHCPECEDIRAAIR